MRIKLALPEAEADYFRHARTETLKSIGEEIYPEAIEPQPIAMTFLAYDEDGDESQPIAFAEVTFHEQVYPSYAEGPYPASFELEKFCPFPQMAGIRTIFVEPEYRHRAGSLYLQMIYAGTNVVEALGGSCATASTRTDNEYLRKIYRKTGGAEMDPFRMVGMSKEDVSVFVFKVDDLLNHKLIQRAAAGASYDLDMDIARTIRSRSIVKRKQLCA